MNKIVKEIKNNKFTVMAVLGFALLLGLGYGTYLLIVPQNSALCGNRLEGMEKVAISNSDFTNLFKELEKNDSIVKATGNLNRCKTVNVTLTIKKGVKQADAKKLAPLVSNFFSKEQQAYFDFQVFFKNENKDEKGYPMIGYLAKNAKSYSFSAKK